METANHSDQSATLLAPRSALEAPPVNSLGSGVAAGLSATEGMEDQALVPVGVPVAAKERERILGKRDGVVRAAFAGAYMHKHRPRVHVVDGECECFAEAQSTGRDG